MEGRATRYVVVGGGKMGEAILSGWLASSSAPAASIRPEDMTVVNPGVDRRDYLEGAYRVACVGDVSEVPALSRGDVVVLAVKPQVIMQVLQQMAALPAFSGGESGPLFISIAAGVRTERLEAALPEGAPVVRVMPNMPLVVSEGASGVCGGARSTREQVEFACALFGCLGRAAVVEEDDMDVVCALSGSGPAYVALMIEELRDAAARRGLEAELAQDLALQTVLGTARLIAETGTSPAAARESICSPGGTTLAALEAMRAAGFGQAVDAGIGAAEARSRELARA